MRNYGTRLGRRQWGRAFLGLALVATLVPLWTQPASAAAGPTLSVDAAAENHAIDPRIYGINSYLLDPALAAQIDLPVERSGGDGASEYNWQKASTSYAANWYNEIFGDDPGNGPADQVARNDASGTQTMLTLPIMGWVANAPGIKADPAVNPCAFPRSVYPDQTAFDPYGPPTNSHDCGSGWTCPAGTTSVPKDENGNEILDGDSGSGTYGFGSSRCEAPDGTLVAPNRIQGNDPTLADACPGGRPDPAGQPYACDAPAAFDAGWVQHMVDQFGTAAQGGVELWSLDNEPDLWNDTHHHVHPQCATYDEIFEHGRDVARAIKAVDPTAQTLGPVMSDTLGDYDVRYYGGQDWETPGTCSPQSDPSPDNVAHGDFVPWYLAQMKAAQAPGGPRLLDVLDQHFYPQACNQVEGDPGEGECVTLTTTAGEHPQSQATRDLRLRTTRSLWDPTYVDESWQGQDVHPGLALDIIPKMKEWTAPYPGMKTAITEYNFGGLDDVNGALAQADALGIFAREGLDIATFWPDNGGFTAAMPGANAFRIFRNYDGHHSTFGDTWVKSSSGNDHQSGQGQLAVYSAKRADGALTTVVINKTRQDLTSPLGVSHFSPAPQAQVWRYSRADDGAIVRQGDVAVSAGGSVTTTYPAESITLLVMPARTTVATTLTAEGIVLNVNQGLVVHPNLFTPKATLLRGDGTPIAGQPVAFTAGTTTLCTGTTDAKGVATCANSVPGALAVLLNLGYQARYAGTATYDPATAKGPLLRVGGLAL